MRQLVRVVGAAIAVLAFYFAYLSLHKSPAHQPQFEKLRTLVRQLEQHRDAKGGYPQAPDGVPIGELEKALADSGVAFRTSMDFANTDPDARYLSIDGDSYGILFHFHRANASGTCIVEMRTFWTGWWGQPPPCPL
jgi:hypothetical protein